MNNIKQKIKKILLLLKLNIKYKKFIFKLGDNTFISTKANIILGENSKLVIGNNCYISDNTRLIVHDNSELILHDNVYVSINTLISSNSKVIIDEDTLIAHNITILDTNKRYSSMKIKIREQGYVSNEIYIGKDCWIGAGAIILPGVNLANHCIVGANAVVTKSFSKGSVLAGVPAKIIRNLDEESNEK